MQSPGHDDDALQERAGTIAAADVATVSERVLIVEDDPDVMRVARSYLEREGYEVEEASDGLSGLHAALAHPPHLIVLDWMLPQMDGMTVLKRLRREAPVPVIVLTARTEEGDRIVGLDAGADDYVTKPFSPRELVARVRAVLRRVGGDASRDGALVAHAGLELDRERRTVRYHDTDVPVTTLEFDLLHTMAQTPGRVFTRGDLLDRVWGDDFAGVDRVVDVHVSNLRQKLVRVGGEGLVRTVRGVGYKVE
ncbi:MAG: response regulator transcription factor [Trueperaceae bacterium]